MSRKISTKTRSLVIVQIKSSPICMLNFKFVVGLIQDNVVLRHTLPIFTGLGRCPIINWDFAGAVSIFGPDALPVVHQ